jgi:hypothetical protein
MLLLLLCRSWGDGFITNPDALQQHRLGDPTSTLATLAKVSGRIQLCVLSSSSSRCCYL